MNRTAFQSVLTWSQCGFSKEETMPTDAWRLFYTCKNGEALLRPDPGDYCVLYSFGPVKCPSIRQESHLSFGCVSCCTNTPSDGHD